MTLIRALFASLFAVVVFAAQPASAAEWQNFTPEAFAAAQREGKPILIDVHAPWCPTCRAQKPILADLTKAPKYKDLVLFRVDFDDQKDALRALNAQKQSTLIVFKGDREIDRSVGDTSQFSIEGLLDKTL
jgi:thioredoxin 1